MTPLASATYGSLPPALPGIATGLWNVGVDVTLCDGPAAIQASAVAAAATPTKGRRITRRMETSQVTRSAQRLPACGAMYRSRGDVDALRLIKPTNGGPAA